MKGHLLVVTVVRHGTQPDTVLAVGEEGSIVEGPRVSGRTPLSGVSWVLRSSLLTVETLSVRHRSNPVTGKSGEWYPSLVRP